MHSIGQIASHLDLFKASAAGTALGHAAALGSGATSALQFLQTGELMNECTGR